MLNVRDSNAGVVDHCGVLRPSKICWASPIYPFNKTRSTGLSVRTPMRKVKQIACMQRVDSCPSLQRGRTTRLRRKRTPRRPLLESIEKSLCRLEVGRVEALGEPVVDRLEERHRVGGTALIAQQPGEARGGAQFPG